MVPRFTFPYLCAKGEPESAIVQRPRILLADDDVSIRTAITRLLSELCDVVGHADDTATLLDSVPRLRPDVVVLDFSLPGGLTSMEVCRRLTTSSPAVAVVALTAYDDP
jgi:DNA-binding NarL/FixJ family response regulator